MRRKSRETCARQAAMQARISALCDNVYLCLPGLVFLPLKETAEPSAAEREIVGTGPWIRIDTK